MKFNPEEHKKLSLGGRLKNITYALNGLWYFFRTEANAPIHSVAAILVIIAGFVLHISQNEWMWIALGIAIVFISEIINTAIENLCDFASLEYNELIGRTKDLAAAAVVVATLLALFIFGMVFFF